MVSNLSRALHAVAFQSNLASRLLPSVSLDGVVVFAGGRDFGHQALNIVDIYREAEQLWAQATLSVPRWNMAAAVAGDTALFAGRRALYLHVVELL
jgi:hypothetical protein